MILNFKAFQRVDPVPETDERRCCLLALSGLLSEFLALGYDGSLLSIDMAPAERRWYDLRGATSSAEAWRYRASTPPIISEEEMGASHSDEAL